MILYVKRGCPWCVDAVAHLDKLGFCYEEVDVRRDPAAMERMFAISGQTLAPTLEVGGKVLADFDTGQLDRFLKQHGIEP